MVWGASPRPSERKLSYSSFHPVPVPDGEPTMPEYEGPYEDDGLWF